MSTPATEGIPNVSVTLKSTSLLNMDRMLPAIPDIPTTNMEYTPEESGSFFKIYTNTGIVNMDPPAPINPSDKPIPSDAAQTSNSFMPLILSVSFIAWVKLICEKSEENR